MTIGKKVNQIQNDYIKFIRKEALENELQEETIAGITKSTWLIFNPDGSIKAE